MPGESRTLRRRAAGCFSQALVCGDFSVQYSLAGVRNFSISRERAQNASVIPRNWCFGLWWRIWSLMSICPVEENQLEKLGPFLQFCYFPFYESLTLCLFVQGGNSVPRPTSSETYVRQQLWKEAEHFDPQIIKGFTSSDEVTNGLSLILHAKKVYGVKYNW